MVAMISSTFTLFHHSTKLHFLIVVFFLLSPFATPFNFSFPSFKSTDTETIQTEGDADCDTQFLRLTKSAEDYQMNQSVGRAYYRKPFLLQENATGRLADFNASFVFAINSANNTNYGDGLAFFIAPHLSLPDGTIAAGGALGLPSNPTGTKNETFEFEQKQYRRYSYVAVEFDIYQNTEPLINDPSSNHVGIDANSLKSLVTKNWSGGILDGTENSAVVSYNSSTKNLSVAYTTFVNGSQVWNYLNYRVDLKEYLPDSVVVGFSASTGEYLALHKINSWNFTATSLGDHQDVEDTTSNGVNIGLAIGLSIGGCAILLGGFGLAWFIVWKKKETEENSGEDPLAYDFIDDEFEKGAGPRKFSYSELARATSNFGEAEKLGEGGFGGVYKGFIPDMESYVAVKRISRGSKQGIKEYASEVKIISRLRHRNLVQLIGWCHEKKLLLVYDYMPNGSLDSQLFKDQSLLTWDSRYRIAQGLASGLLYLHQDWEQCVLHRDIKSSNVMLDSNFNAKLGDFGLARLVDHGKQSETTIVAGTMGYMAPDYLSTGKASMESDVYSFGVVALEISCGRKPIDEKFGTSQVNMVGWVWELYGQDRVIEAADPKLRGEFDEKQMECLMIVGLWCAHPDYKMRPSMQQALQVLNFEVPLPILPSKMPVATYFSPPKSLSMLSSSDTRGSQGGGTESSGYGYNTNSSQFTASSSGEFTNSHPSIPFGKK